MAMHKHKRVAENLYATLQSQHIKPAHIKSLTLRGWHLTAGGGNQTR